MSVSDRCPVCDRPEATAERWARVERDENIPAAEGASVCWGVGEPQCLTARVDWRARALAAVTALAGRGGLGVVAVVGPDDAPFPEDALRGLVAALDAYAATDGQPWAERIEARKRVDEARAAVARMEGGR